ncbi:Gfo/Idh/MocA family oxidoreductase [Streptomyces natalensis]|uniref:Gfo/Idh/MocA family oxidoreductase n=1 Tax=Streptomyces natalensis TaxID=68242 RepID=UPI000AFBCE3D|nr:Gfo/Idh/MocA family oxidoreductase [Streptomyces natalensis]
MRRDRPRAVVVGTTFGAHYARALAGPYSPVELVGVAGTGGQAGRHLAAELGVRYLAGTDEIESAGAGLAVVAVRSAIVGGQGDEICRDLLGRGIPVLQELPVHSADVVRSARAAQRSGAAFAVTGFYEHLEPVRRFIAAARALDAVSPVTGVELRTSIQVLHASLGVLSRILTAPPGPDFAVHPAAATAKSLVSTDWGGVAVDVLVRNGYDARTPDDDCQPLMGFVLGTPDGELSLAHVHGPTRWEPRLHEEAPGRLRHPEQRLSHLFGPDHWTGDTVFPGLWAEGIARAVGGFAEAVSAGRRPLGQRDLAALRHWEAVSARLGRPADVPSVPPKLINIHDLEVCS